jgi:uncharacterized protein
VTDAKSNTKDHAGVLHQPLTGKIVAATSGTFARSMLRGTAIVVTAILAGTGLYVAFVDHPNGGEPVAIAKVETRKASGPLLPENTTIVPSAVPERTVSTATQLENDSGVTVFRPGAVAPGSVIVRVPDAPGVKMAPAPDRRLSERSRFGTLPKLGEDGAKAMDVYARPFDAPPALRNAPRISILVGGLGISQSATADALTKLPTTMSLAFAPYGTEIDRAVSRARSNGHEVFLQVPMEPFDYPDSDPGPHTLLTGPRASENIDKLQWVMGRFTGYVGIVNFMGGRFTADETGLRPVLEELSRRGLMIVDDGSSGRSLLTAGVRGRGASVKAETVIDATPRAEAIDKELAQLEKLARERGSVLATASALPVTVERLSRWARTLESRGIVLAPVSSLAREPATTGAIR